MRKDGIAARIHQAAGISEEEAARLLDWILELFKATLQKGEPIAIHNFGRFTVRSKPSRKGRNPSTGEAMIIPARRVVTFHASSQLKTEVNAVQAEQLQVTDGQGGGSIVSVGGRSCEPAILTMSLASIYPCAAASSDQCQTT